MTNNRPDENDTYNPAVDPDTDVAADTQDTTTPDPATAGKKGTVEEHIDEFLAAEESQESKEPKPQARNENLQQRQQAQGKFSYSKDGSVVDGAGQIVARPGAERRHWERANMAEQRAQRAERAQQELQTKYVQLEQGLAHGKAAGLTNDETLAALQAWGWYKKEPEAMLKWLLTSAQAAGYNILELAGLGSQGNGVNVKAITDAVAEQLKPITERERLRQEQEYRYEQVQTALSEFHAAFPNAAANEQLIVDVMREQPQLTLREAWLQIELWAAKNGFDSSADLRAQAEARMNNQAQPAPRRPAPNMPRGRGGPVETINGPKSSFDEYSNDSIIASAMRENGLDPRRQY